MEFLDIWKFFLQIIVGTPNEHKDIINQLDDYFLKTSKSVISLYPIDLWTKFLGGSKGLLQMCYWALCQQQVTKKCKIK